MKASRTDRLKVRHVNDCDRAIFRPVSLLSLIALALVVSLAVAHAQPSGLRILPVSSQEPTATSLSQYGITWHFANEVQFGQFVNGDYWVIGPVTIEHITPAGEFHQESGGFRNGSMLDPEVVGGQGFDSREGHAYQATLDVSNRLPLTIEPTTSLVSSRGDVSRDSLRRWVSDYAILTVVDKAPPTNSFRPPYVAGSKSMLYTWDDVRTELLNNVAPVPGMPTWAEAEGRLLPPFMNFYAGSGGGAWWGNRLLAKGGTYPLAGYGREVTRDVAVVSLMVNTAAPISARKLSVVGLIQRGIDTWGIYRSAMDNGHPFPFPPNGGVFSGRKLPILFAGWMLGDEAMAGVGSIPHKFHEDAQTFYVGDDEINRPVEQYNWDGRDVSAGRVQAYTEDMRGMPEWGIRHSTVPASDNAHWGAIYRTLNGITTPEYALAVLVMGLRQQWNHEPLFDYSHRYMSLMNRQDCPFGFVVDGQPSIDGSAPLDNRGGWNNHWAGAGTWATAMYDAYWDAFYSVRP